MYFIKQGLCQIFIERTNTSLAQPPHPAAAQPAAAAAAAASAHRDGARGYVPGAFGESRPVQLYVCPYVCSLCMLEWLPGLPLTGEKRL